jgi:hypothetical protein
MYLNGCLRFYTSCLLGFCVIFLYCNTRQSYTKSDGNGFSDVLKNVGEFNISSGRLQRWQYALLSSLRQHRANTFIPTIVSDELSTGVKQVVIFGPPSHTWVHELGLGGVKRVGVVSIVAPGTQLHLWNILTSMQECKHMQSHNIELVVFVVIAGSMESESVVGFRDWTRDFVEKGHYTQQYTTSLPGFINHIKVVTISWIQGSLNGILRETMDSVTKDNVVDMMLWLHPGITASTKLCPLAAQFATDRKHAYYAAGCFDKTQMRQYEHWQNVHKGIHKGTVPNNHLETTRLIHHCNILFSATDWHDHMRQYSTLDAHGDVRWYTPRAMGSQYEVKDTVFISPLDYYY